MDSKAANPPPTDRRQLYWFAGILTVSCLLRIWHLVGTLDDPYFWVLFGDEDYYHKWALRIAEGRIIGDRAFFTSPLYAYFLGGLYALFGPSLLVAKIANLIMGLCTVLLVYMIGRKLFPGFSALLPAALVGFSVTTIFYESFIEKTTLVCMISAAFLLFLVPSVEFRKLRSWFMLGLLGGVALLTHAFLAALAGSAIISIGVTHWREKGKMVMALVSFFLGCFVPVSLSTAHNAFAESDFIPLTVNGGQNFYTGNHLDNPLGVYKTPPFVRASNLEHEDKDFRLEAERRTGRPLRSSEVSKYWVRQGLSESIKDPRMALVRFFQKVRAVFHADELTDTRSFPFYRQRSQVLGLPLPTFGFISVLGILGLAFGLTDRKLFPLHLFLGLFSLLMALFFVLGRFRLPVMIPLAVYSVLAVHPLVSKLRQERYLFLPRWAGMAAVTALFVFTGRAGGTVDFAIDHYNMAVVWEQREKPGLAAEEYTKALAANPNHAGSLGNLANIHIRAGRPDEAIPLLQKVLQMRPTSAEAWNGLGLALHRKGRSPEAIQAYERSLAINADQVNANDNLANVLAALGKYSLAEQYYQKAMAVDPRSWRVRYNLSLLYERTGRKSLAVQEIQEAARIEPDNPLIAKRQDALLAK